jgi:hypothetical protein
MNRPRDLTLTRSIASKEKSRMKKRLSLIALVATTTVSVSLLISGSAAATPSPWWQVLTGSRPSNLWEPSDNIQEIQTQKVEVLGGEVLSAKVIVRGEVLGCMGAGGFLSFSADKICQLFGYPTAIETAAELEGLLEEHFGPGNVQVTGGPAGAQPFTITFPGNSAPRIEVVPIASQFGDLGGASTKVLSPGGSGRLIVTLNNLGDAPVDATETPVTITDELPEGIEAVGAVGIAGVRNLDGPLNCGVEATDLVICTFEGTLPPYEALEVEILANLIGSPPAAGAPGKVAVAGGNVASESVPQSIRVSPEKVRFGIDRFSAKEEEEGGKETVQAGAHPFQITNTIQLNAGVMPDTRSEGVEMPAQLRNLSFPLPAGVVGNATVNPQCNLNDFYRTIESLNSCPAATAIGVAMVTLSGPSVSGLERRAEPVFNLPPGPGEPARFGITALGYPILIETAVDPDNSYKIIASVRNVTQLVSTLSSTVVLWGTPGDPRHDASRGWSCLERLVEQGPCERPPALPIKAFLRAPVSCQGALGFSALIEPWNTPAGSVTDSDFFEAAGLHGCNKVPFSPDIAATPTSSSAGGPSGLQVRLDMPNFNLENPEGVAEGQAKKVEVTLPAGMTVNPSQAEGLEACSPAQYAQERFDSTPGEGCPDGAKIGSVDITTPLLEEEAHGAVYVASPHNNPFDSLLALYLVAKIPARGILVKQAGEVKLDPQTGQIVTAFDNLPQIPFETFKLDFFGGIRAPLVMPESCGSYDLTAKFTPWNAADPANPQPNEVITETVPLTVGQGPNGSPCPIGTPSFKPGFTAGTENNAAGSYSPFTARLTRNDDEQEFRRFSLKLPKGVIGNLSGIPFCSESSIAQARSRTGANGGQEELGSPSCPAASQIGRTLVGAGVGPALTYVPGKVYLAGPYHGAKLSAVAITPAKVGPFDLGNVVIRQALKVDPVTAEVSTDGSSSDPIPHILQGIVVHARDIRVLVDRKDFVLNPTSCERMTASASVSGLSAVEVSSPFQAADCASLGFKPKLSLSLSGGTTRAKNPRLKAVLTARKGDANIRKAVVALPHSEFLDQSHIKTICTRVQFNAGGGNGEQCPKGSVYGRVKAVTPLLDEPLTGPVYLRSSNHPLPDLVAALHSGKVDINLAGRIDSVNGGIRNSFEAVPDAPVTKFTLEMQGGKKGLLVNSTNICRGKHRAAATFTGQNGKRLESHPLLKAKCGGKKKRKQR